MPLFATGGKVVKLEGRQHLKRQLVACWRGTAGGGGGGGGGGGASSVGDGAALSPSTGFCVLGNKDKDGPDVAGERPCEEDFKQLSDKLRLKRAADGGRSGHGGDERGVEAAAAAAGVPVARESLGGEEDKVWLGRPGPCVSISGGADAGRGGSCGGRS